MDLCTVISERFIPQALNLIKSYKIHSYDAKVYVYYFNTAVEKLKIFNHLFGDQVVLKPVEEACPHAFNPRSFFYKTYALYDTLVNQSDAVIYSDSASCFIGDATNIGADLIDDSLFMVYANSLLTNKNWTTTACLEALDAPGAEIMPQYWAGFQAYNRTTENLSFVTEMYENMKNPKVALPPVGIPYPDGQGTACIEHRCDQSVLSILIHKHNRHQSYDIVKNAKYGDWQTILSFDGSYVIPTEQMILSPRESKFGQFRFLRTQ